MQTVSTKLRSTAEFFFSHLFFFFRVVLLHIWQVEGGGGRGGGHCLGSRGEGVWGAGGYTGPYTYNSHSNYKRT